MYDNLTDTERILAKLEEAVEILREIRDQNRIPTPAPTPTPVPYDPDDIPTPIRFLVGVPANVYVVARDRTQGMVLLGGLGILDSNRMMWLNESPHHRDYPGYEDAPEEKWTGGGR